MLSPFCRCMCLSRTPTSPLLHQAIHESCMRIRPQLSSGCFTQALCRARHTFYKLGPEPPSLACVAASLLRQAAKCPLPHPCVWFFLTTTSPLNQVPPPLTLLLDTISCCSLCMLSLVCRLPIGHVSFSPSPCVALNGSLWWGVQSSAMHSGYEVRT